MGYLYNLSSELENFWEFLRLLLVIMLGQLQKLGLPQATTPFWSTQLGTKWRLAATPSPPFLIPVSSPSSSLWRCSMRHTKLWVSSIILICVPFRGHFKINISYSSVLNQKKRFHHMFWCPPPLLLCPFNSQTVKEKGRWCYVLFKM